MDASGFVEMRGLIPGVYVFKVVCVKTVAEGECTPLEIAVEVRGG